MMKLIIAGSRHFKTLETSWMLDLLVGRADVLADIGMTSEVLSGGAEGVDMAGELWATKNHLPVRRFKAAWAEHGKAAGPIRNQEMAAEADALLLIWDGQSPGSADMLRKAKAAGLPIVNAIHKGGDFEVDMIPRGKPLPGGLER